jgi:nitrogen fixation protein FixH
MSDPAVTPAPAPSRQSRWRFYPWAVAGAMGVVAAANAALVWSALATFPGPAVAGGFGTDDDDSFQISNDYDRVLAAVDRQHALGWSVAAEGAAGRPLLRLTGPDGSLLSGARIEATAMRPLGPPEVSRLTFHAAGGGRYAADAALPRPGRWDLMLRIVHAGSEMRVTRRVVVR